VLCFSESYSIDLNRFHDSVFSFLISKCKALKKILNSPLGTLKKYCKDFKNSIVSGWILQKVNFEESAIGLKVDSIFFTSQNTLEINYVPEKKDTFL